MAGSSKEVEEKGSKPQKKWRPAGSVGIAHDSQSWGQEFEPQARGRGHFKKCTRAGTHPQKRSILDSKRDTPTSETTGKVTGNTRAKRGSGLRRLER